MKTREFRNISIFVNVCVFTCILFLSFCMLFQFYDVSIRKKYYIIFSPKHDTVISF